MKFARRCQSASREGAVWSVKDSRRTSSQRRQGPRQTAAPRHRSQKRAPAGLWPASFGSHRLLASAVAESQRCGQMPAGASSARRSSTHRGGTSRRAKRHAGGVHGFGEGRRVPFGQALGATRARERGRKNGTVLEPTASAARCRALQPASSFASRSPPGHAASHAAAASSASCSSTVPAAALCPFRRIPYDRDAMRDQTHSALLARRKARNTAKKLRA